MSSTGKTELQYTEFEMIKDFIDKQQAIYSCIDKIGHKVNPSVGCFHDGVAYPETYLGAKRKVMWVLKNSYDDSDEDGNPVSDGQDIRDWICDEALELAAHKQIFVKMALASYCLQNDIPYSEALLFDKAKIMQALKAIALVDLSKLPGGKTISDKELKKEFSYFQNIVSAQIDLYKPDVVIFGNTLHLCYQLFPGLNYSEPDEVYESDGNCLVRFFSDSLNNCTYIEAYHPSYPLSYEDFAGTIVNAAQIKSDSL